MVAVIVDAAIYVAGTRVATASSIEELAGRPRTGGFAWLGLRMPNEDELRATQKAFDIPDLVIEDALRKHDRPKVELHGSTMLTVVPTARYVDSREEVDFGELFFFVGADYVVTVRYGQAAPLAMVRADLEADEGLLRHGAGAVLQAALAHVVASYRPVVAGLEHDVREVERDVFSVSRYQPTRRIYFLIREVLDFLVALEPMASSVKKLTSVECSLWVPNEIKPLFTDVDDELSEIVADARSLHQMLGNALAASFTQASLRQNEDTRRISAWVAIGVIPTIVAGLFGMNLGGIPGADHPAGFAAVTALTALVCYVLYRKFKDAEWL
jgi:magnesium transporter